MGWHNISKDARQPAGMPGNTIQRQNTALRKNTTKLQRNEVAEIRSCCAVEAPRKQPNNQTPEQRCSSCQRKIRQGSAPARSLWGGPGCRAGFSTETKSFSRVRRYSLVRRLRESSAGQEDPQEATKAASPQPPAQTRPDHTAMRTPREFLCSAA